MTESRHEHEKEHDMATTTETPHATGTTAPRRRWRRRLLSALGAVLVLLVAYGVWTNVRPYKLEAAVEMDGTPEQVWKVLTDLSAYPQWNPFIVSSSGDLRKGGKLRNVMRDASGDTTFTPEVLAVEPGRELRWVGKITPGGIFDGEHRFTITRLGENRVRLVQTEEFRGVLVPFLRSKLHNETLPQFHAMNRALSRQVTNTAP